MNPDLPLLQSRENPRLRLLARLVATPRACRKAGFTVLDGVHLLSSLLQSGQRPVWGLLTAAALARDEVVQAVQASRAIGTEWFEVPAALFTQLAPTAHPSGVLSVLPLPSAAAAAIAPRQFVLLLEDIQDPGNLGTLLRAAHGAGVTAVALSPGCTEAWAPRVLRAGMGAHFSLVLHEDCDLAALAMRHGGIWAAAADGAHTLWQAPLGAAGGVAIGNEGAGLSTVLRAACAGTVAIPLAAGCESLNAGVAGALLMFEWARQRG